jgi:hypothetical protein
MLEPDNGMPLTRRIEPDDAYLVGKRAGGVETTPDGKPVRLKVRPVTR